MGLYRCKNGANHPQVVKRKSKKIITKKIRIVIYYLGMEVRRTFDPIAVTTAELKNKAFSMLEEVFET